MNQRQGEILKNVALNLMLPLLMVGASKSAAAEVRTRMNFFGAYICIKITPNSNPHAHQEWQHPLITSTRVLGAGLAVHRFDFDKGAAILTVREEQVAVAQCRDVSVDRGLWTISGKVELCLTAEDPRYPIKVNMSLVAKNAQVLNGVRSSIYSVSYCHIENVDGPSDYIDGNPMKMGEEIRLFLKNENE